MQAVGLTGRHRVRGRGAPPRTGEEGFLLIGALVAVFLVLLVLSIAAPTVARQLRREREIEAMHRGNQYVRAVRMFYLKNGGHYPGTIEQLEKTNNVRFLRQRYVDPMTGKADWRLIHLGEQKTTVKGFFGQPLAGVASPGLGSVSGMNSGIGGGPSTVSGSSGSSGSAFGSSGTTGSGGSGMSGGLGSSSAGSSSFGSSSTGSSGTVAGSPGTSGSSSSSGISSQSATSFTGTGAPIMGVGSSAAGDSIVVLNEQTTYPTWEFIYDPRVEQLKAKVNLLGGGMASTSATGLGSANSLSSPTSATPTSSTPGASTPAGSTSPQ